MQEDEAPDVKRIIDACRSLQADAVALELADRTIVVALNSYDGTHAVASCGPEVNLSAVVRGLLIRLYSEPSGERAATYLSAVAVRSALLVWERQIALVFGRRYASGLVAGESGTMLQGEVTCDDLEATRRRLTVAIGGCIELKAEK
jgi:hypothetical protein